MMTAYVARSPGASIRGRTHPMRHLEAASAPRRDELTTRLLRLDPRSGAIDDATIAALPSMLRPGDLVVVNDAATLPASLAAIAPGEVPVEIRLASQRGPKHFVAVLFGEGDYRTPTERRPPPPHVDIGAELRIGALRARVVAVSPISPRLVELELDREGGALFAALYAAGHPVQYAHVPRALDLWSVQTAYAARPWAMEMPSAGRPLRWSVLLELARKGVVVRALTHAAGLSATGDPALDRALPLPERFEIPEETAAAVAIARRRGGRVVAVGTSVVRALEGCALREGSVVAGLGETDLVIAPGFVPRVVDGVLSGMHEPETSHYSLLSAFASSGALARAHAHAVAGGYLGHELGDAMLVLPA